MNALNKEVSETIHIRRSTLAAKMVEREFERHPELDKRYGKLGRAKCLEDAIYHLAYLGQAIAADEPTLFGAYIAWAKVMLAKRGVPAADLAGLLETMSVSLRDALPPEVSAVACAFVDAGLRELPQLPDDIPSFIDTANPLGELAAEYLRILLKGERRDASKLILQTAESGTPVRDLYLQVFQRTQHEIGRLWQVNQISVAQEHYSTAATQLVMSQLYPYVFASGKTRGSVVGTCVAGDLHEIGARMVTDFFEMEGWRTQYLGANVPTSSIVQTLIEQEASVLAISVTITFNVGAVESLINAVREAPACSGVKILVGGYPFKLAPDLWRKVGADGSAGDAQEAVAVADRLTSGARAA